MAKQKVHQKKGELPVVEIDVRERGEVDLHSVDAIDRISALEASGTPVDDKTIPQPPAQPAAQQPIQAVPPPAKGVPRILVVIPILDITFDFFKSFMNFWQQLMMRQIARKAKYEIGYHFLYRKPVHIAETMGVQIAQFNKCTHILFMDDDIYDITPEMVDLLLEADKDVISGVMYASGFPYAMCTFRRFDAETTVSSQPAQKGLYRLYEIPCTCPHCMKKNVVTKFPSWSIEFCPVCRKAVDPKKHAVQPVDLIPFCFTLMKMSVFDRINKPWFHCNSIFPTDSWFADRCAEVGIQEYAHMLVRLNHRGVNDVTRVHKFNEGLAIAQSKQKGIIQLTPQQMETHIRIVEAKMEEAEKKARAGIRPKFHGIK